MANHKKPTGLSLADKLKKTTLQSAIQGKLTEQTDTDGKADELLKQIQDEKAKLIADKVIKKEKPLAPISDDEKPFDIPDNWVWVRLGEIFHIARGGSPRPIQSFLTTDESGLNWIKIGDTDIGGKYIKSTKEKIKREGLEKTRFVKKGSLLLTNSMSYGRPYILGINGCIHDGWLSLSPLLGKLNKEYFFYLLSSPNVRMQFNQSVSGAVVKNLNSDKVRDTLIPLPPLAEQHRIVAKLDEILPHIDRLGENETRLNALQSAFPKQMQASLLQSAIQGKLTEQTDTDGKADELLKQIQDEKAKLIADKVIKKEKPLAPISDDEKPFDIPDNWVWVRLGEIGLIQTGTTPSKNDTNNYGSDFPFFKPSDLNQGENIVNSSEMLSKKGVEKARIATKNSILINGIGNIGNLGILKKDGAFNQQMHSFTAYSQTHYKIIYYFLKSPIIQEIMQSNASQTTLPILNKSKFENIPIPLPPLAEQHRIVVKLDEILPAVQRLADCN